MKKNYFGSPSNYIYNIIVIISFFLSCICLFKYSTSSEYLKFFYLKFLYFFIITFLVLFLLRFILDRAIITYINISLLSIGVALIIMELFININIKKSQAISDLENRAYHAKKLGLEFDKRSKFEVYNEMLKRKVKVAPSIPPNDFFVNYKFYKSKEDIYSLSGVSNIKTVFCNEGGKRIIYESDRHGFRNKKEVWDRNEVDFILLGDSYAQGACVKDKDTIHERISFYTNKSILNLGYQGHGPLMQLAALKEYGSTKKPKKIIWFYLETNDIDNLVYEYQWDVFKNYLIKPSYSQNLLLKQEQINKNHNLIIKLIYADKEIGDKEKKSKTKYTAKNFVFDLKQVIKLYNLRLLISYFIPREYSLVNDYYSPLKTFKTYEKILDEAIKVSSKWGGQIYFVYIPSSSRYFSGGIQRYSQRKYEYMKKMILGKKLRLIDLKKEVFEKYDNQNLYPLNLNGHPNEKGYDLIAEYISKILMEK